MHELLDALLNLFDILLTPFSRGTEPRQRWLRILGLIIAIVGVLFAIAIVVSTLLGL